MSPVARLWRRAPAWRLCLVIAVATTALAAMFPPGPPGWLPLGRRPPAGVSNSSAVASFVPQPGAAPADYATEERPALGTPLSGVIPFNGRQLPLPAGEWQVIERGRSAAASGAANVQVESFARLSGRAITGVLVALTPDVVSGGLPPPGLMQRCLSPDAMARQVAPAEPSNPLAGECWVMGRTTLGVSKNEAGLGNLVLPELERFAKAGVSIPQHMLALDYRRSDQHGWVSTTLLLPDRPANTRAEQRRLEGWARGFALLFHRGFDGTLETQLPAKAVRDPE